MFRLLFVCLLSACANAALHAQSVGAPINGSFNTDNYHIVRVDIDYGATPQPLTIDVDVISLAGPTFVFEWIDWDGFVAGLSGVSQAQQVMPLGGANAQLATPARSGVHPFVLRLDNILSPGEQVDFAFSLTLSAGSMLSYSESDRLFNTTDDPYRRLEGDLAATFVSTNADAALDTSVELLLGATPQAADLRFDCSAQGVQQMIVSWQASGGDGQIVIQADSNGDIPYFPTAPIRQVSIPASSGPVVVRVIIIRATNFVYADWTLSAPGGVMVNQIAGPGPRGGGTGSDNACTGSAGGAVPLMLAIIAAWSLRQRRRLK